MYGEVRHAVQKVHETWVRKSQENAKTRPKGPIAVLDPATLRLDAANQYYCQLLSDLVIYLDCRAKLVDLRVLLHKKTLEDTTSAWKQGLATLSAILLHLPLLKHQLLVQLSQNMSVEVLLFQKLLQTELAIANYQASQAIFHFTALDVELKSCQARFNFLQDKASSSEFLETSLYHWYLSFRDQLHEKLTFLFAEFRSLREESTVKEPFTQEAGAELILHEKIVEFVAQSGCFNVSLVLRPADGMGSGKSSWVPVYTCPQQEAPFSHWPSIISLYQDNTDLLDTPIRGKGSDSSQLSHTKSGTLIPTPVPIGMSHSSSKGEINIPLNILHYFDTHVDTTYFMATLQPKMLLVVIFNGERQEDDTTANTFIKGLYANLRHSQLLQKVLSRASGTSSPSSSSSSRGQSPAPAPSISKS
jgi:hypothetical protein